MADTIGGSLDLGMHIGIEGLGNDLSSSIKMGASLVRTFSHLKPVKSLKLSMKEPYKNMFVNFLKKSLADKYLSLSELKNMNDTDPEKNKKAQEFLKLIEKELEHKDFNIEEFKDVSSEGFYPVFYKLINVPSKTVKFRTDKLSILLAIDIGLYLFFKLRTLKDRPRLNGIVHLCEDSIRPVL
jgi:hypothetical protein